MCGIIGFCSNNNLSVGSREMVKIIKKLMRLSETRGKDASGIAISTNNELKILKKNVPAHKLIKSIEFRNLLSSLNKNSAASYKSLIGHSRMVTNGDQNEHHNNQPVIKEGIVVIHNGIIVNDLKLWSKYKALEREYEVDTEIIAAMINFFEISGNDIITCVRKAYSEIEGVATIAVLFDNYDCLLLASNNGSLFYIYDELNEFFVFASEKHMLKVLAKKIKLLNNQTILQMESGTGCLINLKDMSLIPFGIFDDMPKDQLQQKKILKKISDQSPP